MSAPDNRNFYADISGFKTFSDFSQPARYEPLPDDWLVVITDVQGSTRAIQNGRYKDVNAVGAASIVALLNAVKPLQVPFIFGGDGAMLCAPVSFREKIAAALRGAKQMAEKSFGLSLRPGLVDMKEISKTGRRILVGKYAPSPHYAQAMFMGDGLDHAEELVKKTEGDNPHLVPDSTPSNADFTGFECRWNEVPSPHGETVTILIKALSKTAAETAALYAEAIRRIMDVYGDEETHHPLRAENLTLAASARALSTEAGVKGGLLSALFYSWAGRWLMWKGVQSATADWKNYKKNLIANTDFRKFDGALRMVISGSADQRRRLRAFLEESRLQGRLVYGLHANPCALITCLISNYDRDHVHFIDGSAGGYALAAKELKEQLNARAC